MKPSLPAHASATSVTYAASRTRQAQINTLSRSVAIEESSSPYLIKAAMFMTSLGVAAFIAWAAITPISEVARAPGDIVPKSRTRQVQHMDGGVIAQIYAQERMQVKAGDLLMRLDGTGSRQDLAELESSRSSLQLKAERLSAFLENRAPDFTQIAATPESTERERVAWETMRSNAYDEEQVIRQQLAQKVKSVSVYDAQAAAYRRNLALSQRETNSYEALHQQGLTTEPRLLDAKRRMSDSQGQLASTIGAREQAKEGILEYEQRIKTLTTQRREEALSELIAAKNELAQTEERITKLQERVTRLEVRSPINGVVKGLNHHSEGSVIRPGETLFEIVPTGDTLIADIRINPKDVGHLHTGQDVRVKISSYDFSRYGALDGKLDMISATTFTDEQGSKYYAGSISLASSYLTSGGRHLDLVPGMTVEADIITGRKTVLAYLLKPVRVAMDGALTEK